MRLFLTIFLSVLILGRPAMAEDPAQTITLENGYAFATMPGMTTGAAFMTLHNAGSEADTLVGVKSDVAKINELHENMIDPDDGTMMMRKIKSITIPAGGKATLEPKGMHVMLIKLSEPLTLDSSVPLTLVFEKAGDIGFDIPVIQPGTAPQEKTSEHQHAPESEEENDDGFPVDSFSGDDNAPEEIEHF